MLNLAVYLENNQFLNRPRLHQKCLAAFRELQCEAAPTSFSNTTPTKQSCRESHAPSFTTAAIKNLDDTGSLQESMAVELAASSMEYFIHSKLPSHSLANAVTFTT